MKSIPEYTMENCIHCKKCTRSCSFLLKYNMDLSDFAKDDSKADSCFLCGKCDSVCPKKLSGVKVALEHRKNQNRLNAKIRFMKNRYKLRNNSKQKSRDLLYLGCNYPGYYPQTSRELIRICKEMGIDYSVDCCKKIVYELGSRPDMGQVKNLMAEKGVQRLICCCPNCYHFLKQELDIEVIDVYSFLKESGLGTKIEEKVHVFFPCSDRYKREIFTSIQSFISEFSDSFQEINCCGLGGGAVAHERELVLQNSEKMKELGCENVYTYCSSCSGIFRNTYKLENVKNFLSEILGVKEEPSQNYAKNVLMFKFRDFRG